MPENESQTTAAPPLQSMIEGEPITQPSVLAASIANAPPNPNMPASPQDIAIQYEHAFVPTADELGLIHDFREQVFKIGEKTGVAFGTLTMSPGKKDHSMAVSQSLHEPSDITAPSVPTGRFEISSNMDTLASARENGRNLEAVIRHEVGHALLGTADLHTNLMLISDGLRSLSNASAALKADTPSAIDNINEISGSVENFYRQVLEFQQNVMPAVHSLEATPQVLNATPERLARWIEDGNESLGSITAQLTSPRVTGTLADSLWYLDVNGEGHKNTGAAAFKPELLPPTLLDTLDSFSADEARQQSLDTFSRRFKKSEEYVVDRFADETAEDRKSTVIAPSDVERALTYHESRGKSPSILDKETISHPSNPRRILRSESIKQGFMPSDETLQNFSPFSKVDSVALGQTLNLYPEGFDPLADIGRRNNSLPKLFALMRTDAAAEAALTPEQVKERERRDFDALWKKLEAKQVANAPIATAQMQGDSPETTSGPEQQPQQSPQQQRGVKATPEQLIQQDEWRAKQNAAQTALLKPANDAPVAQRSNDKITPQTPPSPQTATNPVASKQPAITSQSVAKSTRGVGSAVGVVMGADGLIRDLSDPDSDYHQHIARGGSEAAFAQTEITANAANALGGTLSTVNGLAQVTGVGDSLKGLGVVVDGFNKIALPLAITATFAETIAQEKAGNFRGETEAALGGGGGILSGMATGALGGSTLGPVGAVVGAIAGGFGGSYAGRKLADLLYDQRNANPNEQDVMKQYVASQWENRYDSYEQALASGDRTQAENARAVYENYLTNSLLRRGYLDKSGFETALKYAEKDHTLAENNGFHVPKPQEQDAAYHDTISQQSIAAAQAARSLVQGGSDSPHVEAQSQTMVRKQPDARTPS